MVKQCSACGKDLPTALDEYGPFHALLCRDCFLAGKGEVDPRDVRLKEITDEMIELDGEIQEHHEQIWALEDRKIDLRNERRKILEGDKEPKIPVIEPLAACLF